MNFILAAHVAGALIALGVVLIAAPWLVRNLREPKDHQ